MLFNWFKIDKNFEAAIAVVLKHEGLFSNDLSDPGGATNYGISLRFLRAAGIDGSMNRSDHIGIEDIEALNPDKAKAIYYKYFWKKYNINYIASQTIATSLMDMAVLIGGNEAIILMQLALKTVNADGILGIKSIAAINSANEKQLNYDFKEQCRLHFLDLTAKNVKLKVFYDGWINRVNSL
jgi:lysozyme family protein